MSAPKRTHTQPLHNLPPSKRQSGEPPNESSRNIINLLKICSQKQQNYITCIERFLDSLEPRFQRLRPHLQYLMTIEMERVAVQSSIKKQIKKPSPYGSYEEELYDALQQIPVSTRDNSIMETLPKLRKTDLEDIEWPEMVHNWTPYSIYWNTAFEEADECRNLNERIQDLDEKLEKARLDYGGIQSRKLSIKLLDENRHCPFHADQFRNFEDTELREKLVSLIRKSFEKKAFIEKLKARTSPYHWKCHECRAPSDKVLTNWALMQLIKEIPGQPQREVVNAPQAVPIVPTPWRLERVVDNINRGQADRAPVAQAPVAPAPVAQAPVAPAPVAPAPVAPAPVAPAPVVQAPVAPAPVAPAPVAPAPGAPAPVVRRLQERAPIVPNRMQRAPLAPAPAIRHVLPPIAQAGMPLPPRAWAPAPAPRAWAPPNAWAPVPVLWHPVQVPQMFPAPWAPLPAPMVPQLAPDAFAAPQNPHVGHLDRDEDDELADIVQEAPEAPAAPAPDPEAAPEARQEPMDDEDVGFLEIGQPNIRPEQIEEEIEYIVLD
ncbi:hypothetical protein CAEBREN_04232 [Caenorhabditis brenneri]|uniref:Uncharacterized protein n=1 Tax=Caenorhabditis brenneri TaxID=135651 RepID=G0P1B9_CAEBE|nr:hypothetical protein CAEBREN_04232 [Caenorhabditis brenneri]